MLSNRSFILLHFLICSIGLLKIPEFLAWLFNKSLHRPTIVYQEGIRFLVFPEKREELFFYLLTIVSYFIYYLIIYIALNRKTIKDSKLYVLLHRSNLLLSVYLLGLLVVNILILALTFKHSPLFFQYLLKLVKFIVWLSVVLLPFYRDAWKISLVEAGDKFAKQNLINRVVKQKVVYYSLLFVICLQMLSMFIPYIQGKLLMVNELMSIPEETIINGKYIDNTNYINQHKLLEYPKYDVEKGMPKPTPDRYAFLPKTELLSYFIEQHRNSYYYDNKINALFINRGMQEDEYKELQELYDTNTGERKAVDRLFYASRSSSLKRVIDQYSDEEISFLNKNQFEMHWQILNRWVMHHHNFLLGPINEYALGKPLNDINIQYGWLDVVFLKKLIEMTGGLTYQNYFKVLFSFYPLYYLLYVALTFLVFKDIRYVVIAVALAIGCLNAMNYQFIFLGPGLNPIRHLTDVFVAGAFFMYLCSNKKYWFIIAVICSLAGVVNNSQFGMFNLAALLGTMLVKFIAEPKSKFWIEKLICGLAGIIGLSLYTLLKVGKNLLLSYYLDGILGFPVSTTITISILIFIIVSYAIIIKSLLQSKTALSYIALYFLLYFQLFLIYWVWNPNDPSLFKIGSIVFSLTAVAVLKLLIEASQISSGKNFVIALAIIVSTVFIYLPSLRVYYQTKSEYMNVFKNHRTYQWKLDTASFTSTMNPKYFSNDVNIINKYSDSTGIYIISKYDNFLPFIAKRYSAMPFPDLQWFLNTDKEVEQCIEKINTDRPNFLFVDADIERNIVNEIIYDDAPVSIASNLESIARVLRLNELKKIYYAVKNNYELIEKGYLISVYKIKT